MEKTGVLTRAGYAQGSKWIKKYIFLTLTILVQDGGLKEGGWTFPTLS